MSLPSVAAVILAAGASRRLGKPKQLLEIEGVSLLTRLVKETLASSCDRILVVLGARRDDMAVALAGFDVGIVVNAGWEEGIASSIRAGIAVARDEGYDGALLMVCDQPRLRREHLRRLTLAFRTTRCTVASRYAGVLGVPAVFPRSTFSELGALHGERGARAILREVKKVTAVAWPDGAVDVDTPEDLAELMGSARQAPAR